MNNWLYLLFVYLSLQIILPFSALAESKFGKMEKSISAEALEKMKIEQNLIFLGKSDTYFENSVFNFEQLGEKAVEPLVSHLRSNKDDLKIVTAVIYTLGRLGKNGARAVPIITPYVNNRDYDIRIAAISALGKIGPASEKSIPTIRDYLTDPDEFTRITVVRSLEGIGTPQAKAIVKEYNKMQLLLKKRREEENNQ